MERTPNDAQRAFEERLTREARRFELRPLLKLLRSRGYGRNDILFRSCTGGTSQSIVESLEFDRSRPRPVVQLTLNLGLLGDNSLLPSYFFEVIEQTRDPERFFDFLRFFDHRLIEGMVYALYPEDNRLLFRDWDRAKVSFLEMMGLGSVSALYWFMQLFFPELKVHVKRHPFSTESTSHAARPGYSALDGSGILGKYYVAEGSGFLIDLIAEEENDARGRSWATVVRRRLLDQVLPRIEDFRLPIVIRLRVLNHASWARVEEGAETRGYLGYDRIQGDAEAGHTIVVYPDPSRLRE